MSDIIDQFSDEEIERYARQLVMPEIGATGQLDIAQAKVAIIGCGGLGANAALTLAQSGIGQLELYDPDVVELSNLHRQPYMEDQIGTPKVLALKDLCNSRNKKTRIQTNLNYFEGSNATLWLDCTDTYETRVQIDKLRQSRTTLIFGSVIGMDAQVTVFSAGSPGFTSIFPEAPSARVTCAAQGVLGQLANLVAQIMAAEALKLVTGKVSYLRDHLMLIDARDWRQTFIEKFNE
ncbi:MAG: HesA/MoeB/ThiF family protein [Alphaproteobacteria bacterium]